MTRPACFFPGAEELLSSSITAQPIPAPASQRHTSGEDLLGQVSASATSQSCYPPPPSQSACPDRVMAECLHGEDTLGQSSALNSNAQDKQSNGGCVSCFSSMAPGKRDFSQTCKNFLLGVSAETSMRPHLMRVVRMYLMQLPSPAVPKQLTISKTLLFTTSW